MARPGYIAVLIAVAAVAAGACGGDEDSASKTSTTSTTSAVVGPQGTTTPPSGATGTGGTEGADAQRTAKSKERKQTGAGEGKPGTAAPSAPTTQDQKPQPHTLTPAELKQVGKQQYEQARILCKAATLEGLARRYGIKNPDPDEVAKAYAAAYLVGLRDPVERGCKAGLREAK
jgi:hypothetical protein